MLPYYHLSVCDRWRILLFSGIFWIFVIFFFIIRLFTSIGFSSYYNILLYKVMLRYQSISSSNHFAKWNHAYICILFLWSLPQLCWDFLGFGHFLPCLKQLVCQYHIGKLILQYSGKINILSLIGGACSIPTDVWLYGVRLCSENFGLHFNGLGSSFPFCPLLALNTWAPACCQLYPQTSLRWLDEIEHPI